MGRGPVSPLIRYLRTVAAASDGDELSDGQLLHRFVVQADEAAFAILVRRHGPLVLGICRRLLHHEQDAEDAFQATFLVLASKAASILRRGSVASWLHGVAARVARKARRTQARRHERAMPLPDVPAHDSIPDLIWRDVRLVLDEEIRRLPERYRAPFVLCYLEGQTNAEAARHLGCPKGTVLSRLARARDRLARRLRLRNICLPAAALSTLLSAESLRAALPPRLAGSTVRLANLLTTGQTRAAGIVSAQVLALTTEGVKSMFWMKMTTILAIALVGSGLTTTILAQRTSAPTAETATQPSVAISAPEKKPESEPVKKKDQKETPLDAVMRKWAEADEKVREMHVRFTRTSMDKTLDEKTITKGEVFVKKPDLWRVNQMDKDGRMETIWLQEKKRLRQFDFKEKTENIMHLPDSGYFFEKSTDGMLKQARWMIFGPQASDFTPGSDIRLAKEDQYYVYLDVKPRRNQDKGWFHRTLFIRGRLVLEKHGYRVRQFWLEHVNGNEVFIDFLDYRTNPELSIAPDSLSKGLPKGWKRIGSPESKDADK